MKDIRQTSEYAQYLLETGWVIEKHDGVYYFIKRIPIIGSVIKLQRPEEIDFKKIQELSKKYRAFQIVIEPDISEQRAVVNQQLRKNDFKLSRSPYLPTKTIHLDLSKSEKQLLDEMKKDARYTLCKSQESIIQESKDIKRFRDAWKSAVGWKRWVPSLNNLRALKKAFGKKALFLVAIDENAGLPHRLRLAKGRLRRADGRNEVQAGLPADSAFVATSEKEAALAKAGGIFLIGDKTGYYWQAFTSKKGRKDLVQYRIVWEGIRWAKKNGAKIFDFEGVYDERFGNKSWKGFSHFKKSFGGSEVEYPGAFVKNYGLLGRLLSLIQ